MAIKKSEIYRSLWKSCDELRGGMDASQYKDYVLTLLFVKYVSDKYAGKPNALIRIPKGGAFDDIVNLINTPHIGDGINKVIGKLAGADGGHLKGVIDIADFNNEDQLGAGQAMQDRLSKLAAIFADLDFTNQHAGDDDLLGDAYEYLMRHFATESGKSKGQFYTPAEVSRIMAKVIGITDKTMRRQSVYDPTCGSGSLLLKAADEAPNGLTIYGQEQDVATTALARMNMILHGNAGADIAKGGRSTLSDPELFRQASLKKFNFVVANPPFSTKSWHNGFDPNNDEYGRFEYGVPPAKNGDYAFLLHVIASMNSNGKGAVILPHGVLSRDAEKRIRTEIVQRGYIKGIIGLPMNLFYGTGIEACIVVLDKEYANANTGIFMINAEKGYIKDGNKNRLRERDIHKIVDVFTNPRDIDGYSRMVPLAEIADEKNAYNLNLPRYIDGGDETDLHDLTAHLQGGIPEREISRLVDDWKVLGAVRERLFKPNGNPDYLTAQLPSEEMRAVVVESSEYTKYVNEIKSRFDSWKLKYRTHLQNIKPNNRNGTSSHNLQKIIRALSDDFLGTFVDVQLIDQYDLYQHLMDYWAENMQDDVHAIVVDGWQAAAQPRRLDKGATIKEDADIIIGSKNSRKEYKTDLIPPALIVRRFYPDAQAEIDALQVQAETVRVKIETLTEQHSGDEGLLEDVKTTKGKLSKSNIKKRMKEIKDDVDFVDEMSALTDAMRLLEKEREIGKQIKVAQGKLDAAVLQRYAALSEREIKELVVDDKWLAWLESAVNNEIEQVTQKVALRADELNDRYAHPLPQIVKDVEKYAAKVDVHLKTMGVTYK